MWYTIVGFEAPKIRAPKKLSPHQGAAQLMENTLPAEFAARLQERASATITHSDFMRTVGEFVVIKDGRVDEDHPQTKIARQALDFLHDSRERSRKVFAAKAGSR